MHKRHQIYLDKLKGIDGKNTVRSIEFEKTIRGHVNKNYCHQTSAVVRLRGTNLFKTNLKNTDDVMIVRSRDFG